MGNITALKRYQAGTLIDSLIYGYTVGGNNTNMLQSVIDNSGSNAGLANGTTGYLYDGNGNMLSASNWANTGGNKSFNYNILNLPATATFATGSATFAYDAAGNKLRKASTAGSTTTYTDYINGIQYSGTTSESIAFIQTEEGKAVPYGTTGYDYTYYLGDNLGNTRLTFDTKNGYAESQQVDDYYPFGLEINRTPYTPKNEYLYNKKELQEEFGEYDYGARFYDPVIGRWNTVDPLAEKSRRWSTYNYCYNNPIRLLDPEGMRPDSTAEQDAAFDERIAAEKAAGEKAADKHATYESGFEDKGDNVNNEVEGNTKPSANEENQSNVNGDNSNTPGTWDSLGEQSFKFTKVASNWRAAKVTDLEFTIDDEESGQRYSAEFSIEVGVPIKGQDGKYYTLKDDVYYSTLVANVVATQASWVAKFMGPTGREMTVNNATLPLLFAARMQQKLNDYIPGAKVSANSYVYKSITPVKAVYVGYFKHVMESLGF